MVQFLQSSLSSTCCGGGFVVACMDVPTHFLSISLHSAEPTLKELSWRIGRDSTGRLLRGSRGALLDGVEYAYLDS